MREIYFIYFRHSVPTPLIWFMHNCTMGLTGTTSPLSNHFNSLAPGRSGFNFKSAIFNLVLLSGIFRSSYDNARRRMSWDLPEDKSTLVHVMAWCRQATSHYLSQCWPRSVSPYGFTRAQWVNLFADRTPVDIIYSGVPKLQISSSGLT